MNRFKLKRRLFLRGAMIGLIGVALLTISFGGDVRAFNQSPQIPLFGTALRGVGPGAIPVAKADFLPAPVTGVTHYHMLIDQFQDQILPAGFGKTTLWGYDPLLPLGGGLFQPPKHLGGIIVAKGRNPNDPTDKNVPIQITFHNLLFVPKHILPIDTTVQDPGDPFNGSAIHLHGGLVPWISDGGPFDWWTPIGKHGLSFLNNQVLNPRALPGSAEYYYPMTQSARFMWYHDHTHGITRLNAYAGAASAMLVRDKFEAGLVANNGLPPYIETSVLSKGKIPVQELPLVFQDKIFVDAAQTALNDPQWNSMVQKPATKSGSLWYAHTYEPNQANGTGRWDVAPGGLPLPDPSVIPEFFGDTMLVNGTAFPEATVQARRYRLRMLNACNARFLNLQLYIDDGSKDGITLNPTTGAPTNAPFINAATGDSSWIQIGTEGGFLAKAVKVPSSVPFLITDTDFLTGSPSLDPSKINKSLVVAPAERPDIIVDFSLVPPGTKVVLYNDAPAPFPSGDDRNDYFPGWNTVGKDGTSASAGLSGIGNPVNATTQPGNGPNTRVLMRFKVVAATLPADPPLNITDLTEGIDHALALPWGDPTAVPTPVDVPKRPITLNEYFDEYGRLVQIIGNAAAPYGSPLEKSATYLQYGAAPGATTTVPSTEENVNAGDTEIWEIYNTTGDVHPMHFHLVNVQLINRQLFSGDAANPLVSGAVIPPDPNEIGWKETVPMYPGTVARVIMKFDTEGAKIVDKNLNPITTYPKGTKINGKRVPAKQCLIPGQLPIINGEPPVSPRTGGYEYVWHCHILEHEEHDMMHTMVVQPPLAPPPAP
jgi:spore coat protein A, manganese oxidase